MKTTQLKIEFLRAPRAKVWLFLSCGEGRYIAVPDNREQRYLAPARHKAAPLPAPEPALVPALKSATVARTVQRHAGKVSRVVQR
jgi:hypothetical protein